MENDSRPGCDIDDNSSSLNMECISGQSSTTLGYATTDLSGSTRTTSETALETLVALSPSHGVTTKQLEKQMQSPAKRSLKIVETRKKSRSLRFGRHEGYSFSSISVLKKSEQGLSFLGIRKENMKMAKSGKQSKLDPKELVRHDKQGLKPICERLRRNRLNGHTYKELLRSWARKAKVSGKDKPSQEGGDVIESNPSNEVDKRVVESSSVLTMQRVEYDLKLQLCSSDAKLGHDLSCASLSKVAAVIHPIGMERDENPQQGLSILYPSLDGKDFEAAFSLECREELVDDMQSTESQLNVEVDREHIACAICVLGGQLLCCDGRECKRSFHLSCLDPPLTCAPPGVWHCIWCVQKKIQFGVHSVSESESILDAREVESDHEVLSQKQYLVKYKGLAHVHNRWIPERQLLLETPVLLAKYKRNQITRWKNEWTLPHRLLQKRLLCFPKHCDEYLCGHDGKGLDCNYEWLVKWTGLGYDHATWELENAAFMKSPEVVRLIRDCESCQKNAKRVSCLSEEDKGREITFSELSESPSGGLPGVNNQYVSYINKLRECWYSGKNAVVFDNQDDTLPLLIITTSTSLSMWEAEFSRHESSINVVVYKGNKDVRASIRSLEFYDDLGCVMFQVLLSPPDVVEDLSMLEGLKWGAIIVDEGQRPRMSVLLKKLKAVTADLRLLLVSGQIKDRRADYHNLLAFLDSELDGVKENAFENDPNYDIYKLKESLARFVAFECNLCATSFVEYWVPIQLSNVQLEQYCAALLSNSMLLCSCLKNDSVHSLREILVLTRKCCDHPYLVDVDCSLRKSVTRDFPGVEHLNVDIEVSGKLQLLDKLLLQIKERGLRVLILFQSIGSSGLISIGDILDDFVHQRFGKDSYARIDGGEIIPSKKQAALDLFNGGRSARKKYKCLPRLTDKIDNSICISDSLTVPPAAHGISRGSDGTNASALEETVIEAGQRVRAVIPITREAPTSELIGTSLPTMQPQIFPDQGSEEHPHQAQVSIHPAREGSTGNSSQYMTAVQAGNNHLVQSSPVLPEVPQSDCSDSLQMEMERIQKDKEQAIKLHEDTKMWLKAACEKEIDAVRKRYDMLLQDSETALVQEKKDLETYYNKVYANKLLAKALTEKYDDAKAAGSHGTQQVTIPGFMNEISQLYRQQTASRSKSRLKQSSASLPMTSPPVSPPIQVETHSSEVHQTAGRTTLGPEQSTTNLPMTGAPTIPPAQLVDHSPAVQQTAARMNTGPAEQYSETVPITGSPVSPQVQTMNHASEIQQTTATTTTGSEQSSSALPITVSPYVKVATYLDEHYDPLLTLFHIKTLFTLDLFHCI
ncbi:hypothetical protein ACSBR1_002930 [Camellia fascicularis]